MPDPVAAAADAVITKTFKLDISGTLPGEGIAIELTKYAVSVRTTMDAGLQKRLDAVIVQQVEDLQYVWRNIWVSMGLLEKKS